MSISRFCTTAPGAFKSKAGTTDSRALVERWLLGCLSTEHPEPSLDWWQYYQEIQHELSQGDSHPRQHACFPSKSTDSDYHKCTFCIWVNLIRESQHRRWIKRMPGPLLTVCYYKLFHITEPKSTIIMDPPILMQANGGKYRVCYVLLNINVCNICFNLTKLWIMLQFVPTHCI